MRVSAQVEPLSESSVLEEYKQLIDKNLRQSIASFGEKTVLRDACEYSLLNGGKRFRPTVVLMVAKALGYGLDVSNSALAVEFFHTASLVADDLPCMDNDDIRRNKPAVHKVYGEAVALLVTYALIAAGYERIYRNGEVLRASKEPFSSRWEQVCCLAVGNVAHNTGVQGACGGQFLDIFPPNVTEKMVREVLNKKTVTLFEATFLLGWLFGGGDLSCLEKVKTLAYHFGLAFQIADDLGDVAQDADNERSVNFAALLGPEKAIATIKQELELYHSILSQLKIDSEELRSLGKLLLLRALSFTE